MEWNLWEAIVRVIISLLFICLAAYLFIKFGLAKRYPHNRGSLRVMEQINLTPRASISIVKTGEEFLLVSATDSEVKVIKPMENYQPEESKEIPMQMIENWKRFVAGRGSQHD